MGANDRLNDVQETARRLSVSAFTVRRLIKGAHLKAVRVGKRVLVAESEVERVIEQGAGKHRSEK